MTITAVPYVVSALSHSAELFREAAQSYISGTGVVSPGDMAVTQNGTPNMSVNVAAGQVWIPGNQSSAAGFPTNLGAQTTYGLASTLNEQGSYYAWNGGTVNVSINTSDPSNPRTDLICATVQDAEYLGSTNLCSIYYVQGSAGSGVPSAPANSVVLAQIAVAAGASSITNGNITDERPFVRLLPSVSAQLIASGTGPSVQTDYSTAATALTVTAPLVSGVHYLMTFSLSIATQETSSSTPSEVYVDDSLGYLPAGGNEVRAVCQNAASGETVAGGSTWIFKSTATSSDLFTVSAAASAGALRIPANAVQLAITRLG